MQRLSPLIDLIVILKGECGMKHNLLILGAGVYGLVAKEVAESMGCFEKIDFLDDKATKTPNGLPVLGLCKDFASYSNMYAAVAVAIGNPGIRLSLLQRIEEESLMQIATLVSPFAYISPTAQIGKGSIVEPMAVIHTGSIVGKGCIISAGAVVNHVSICGDGVHVDCNAVIAGNMFVPPCTKVCSGSVYQEA